MSNCRIESKNIDPIQELISVMEKEILSLESKRLELVNLFRIQPWDKSIIKRISTLSNCEIDVKTQIDVLKNISKDKK